MTPSNKYNTLQLTRKICQHHRIGLVCDVDGTLSPIVSDPNMAQITSQNRKMLNTLLTQINLLGIISGRSVTDVRQRVGIPNITYVGNHGMEFWINDHTEYHPDIMKYRPELETALTIIKDYTIKGITIEDKGATVSIHFRNVKDPIIFKEKFFSILEKICEELHLDIFQGRMVFELRPPIKINKGTAFQSIVLNNNLDAAIYIGDDTTDVAALKMARQIKNENQCFSFGIGVQTSETPSEVIQYADYLVEDVSGVEEFLELFSKTLKDSTN